MIGSKDLHKTNILLSVSLIITAALTICCTIISQPIRNRREIIVYSSCSSLESSSDLLYSINQLKNQLKKKHIKIKVDKLKRACGYQLINGKKSETINSSMTDMDLLEAINKFYHE